MGLLGVLVARADTYRDRDRNHPPRGRLQDFRGTTAWSCPRTRTAGHSKTEIQAWTDHVVGLADVNVDIRQGELFVIMGLSGSGKSRSDPNR